MKINREQEREREFWLTKCIFDIDNSSVGFGTVRWFEVLSLLHLCPDIDFLYLCLFLHSVSHILLNLI
jgi:hypothetical protein